MIDPAHTDRLFLRVDEVARACGVTTRTVYNWVLYHKIAAAHIGGSIRIPVSAVQEWQVSAANSVKTLPPPDE
jgi:excisionase family DNA binding protein